MNTRTEERVGDWRTRSVADGYDGLRDLADEGFSGAVRARGATLFMLNGRIVGVFEGSIEDFETADATAHVAPDPSLPLLFTMLEKGGDQRAKYYTEDTPVDEADGTLSSGSFTGYIELSENVLSGDYYVAYYGGKSMSCAFVGNREELITGDEAFERASDEVGIYEVRDVDIEVTDVPEPAADESDDGAGAAAGAGLANGGTETDAGSADGIDPTATAGNQRPAAGVDATDSGTEQTPDPADHAPDAADPSETQQTEAEAADTASADATSGQRSTTPDVDPTAGQSPDRDGGRATEGTDPDEPERASDPDRDRRDRGRNGEATETTSTEDPTAAEGRGTQADTAPTPTDGRVEGTRDASPSIDRAERPDRGSGPSETAAGTERTAESIDPSQPTDPGSAVDPDTDTDQSSEAATSSGTGTTPNVDRAEQGEATAVDPEPDSTPARDADVTAESATESGDEGRESWDADLGSAGSSPEPDDSDPEPTVTEEREWQEARTIPALDPDRTSTGDDGSNDRSRTESAARNSATRNSDAGSTDRQSAAATEDRTRRASETEAGAASAGQRTRQDEALEQEVLEREDKIDQLQQHVTDLKTERDELREERDELRSENESLSERVTELEAEIQRLEGEVERLETELTEAQRAAGGAPNADRRIGEAEALQGTNLFVRYASKGDATLEDAHAGDADADDVNANLRLEHHTQFESGNVAVEGKAFDEFLTGTLEFNFVDWIVGGLLYEIRDTGHAGSLERLYDAIPEIDRAELKGSVSLVYQENGDEVREQKQFDVVLRDRMGNPLIVADLNDSRQPVTESGMATLESSASRVKETNDRLSAAFVVTSSFFEPGALETAAEATSGSFLSRDSKKSFVKLSRKDGYHLCLVEARGTDFHINVPEL
ncbi:DUF7527 domain-containing protein [Halostella salina]|uniref:DUF7527 domain-containing protein n=1 Tax=Halostella salina TaxID=1547897 RepID=UPI000EF7D056|nr:transcriptional regulator [Halostella salina]